MASLCSYTTFLDATEKRLLGPPEGGPATAAATAAQRRVHLQGL